MNLALLLKETAMNRIITRFEEIHVPKQTEKDNIKLWAQVEFGILAKNCQNFGICKIHQYSADLKQINFNKGCACNSSFASLIYSSEGFLEMCFYKNIMSDKVRDKYFSTTFFRVDADFKMPTGLTELFNCGSFLIKAGAHSITETKETYVIKFNQFKNLKI